MILPLLIPSAFATSPDLYGLGARQQGMGAGGVTTAHDGSAAFINPAGLMGLSRPELGLGFSYASHQTPQTPDLWWDTNRDGLLNEADAPLAYSSTPRSAAGIQLQTARPLGRRFSIGLTAYIPTNTLIRFEMSEPALPSYFMYGNRLQRFVAAAGFGVEPIDGVRLGASVNFLTRAQVDVFATIDAQVSPGEDGGDTVGSLRIDTHELTLDVKPAVAPIIGLQLQPGQWFPALQGLTLGVVYQGGNGFNLDANIDVQANIRVQDVGSLEPLVSSVVLQTKLRMLDHYVPPRLSFGVAYQRKKTFLISAEAKYSDWTEFVLSAAHIEDPQISAPFVDLNGQIEDGNTVDLQLRPTWAIKIGAELMLPRVNLGERWKYVQLTARAGVGFEQTPLLGQSTDTLLLDSDRSTLTVGAGVEFWDPLHVVDAPVRLDAFLQHHTLASRIFSRDTLPIRGGLRSSGLIPIGGSITVFGAQWSFAY